MTFSRHHQFHPNNSEQHNRAQIRIANLLEQHGYKATVERVADDASETPLGPKCYQFDVYGEKSISAVVMPAICTESEYKEFLDRRSKATKVIAVEIRNKDSKTKWADYKRKLKTEYSLKQGVRIVWLDIHDVVGRKKISDEQLALELEL